MNKFREMVFISVLFLLLSVQLVEGLSSTTPMFMWSNLNIFNSQNIQEINFISTQQVANGIQKKESVLSTYISSNFEQPELIIVFLENLLLSEDLPQLAHSYETKPNGGALSNLKRLVETSKSSLVIPYVVSSASHSLFVGRDIIESLSKSINGQVITKEAQEFVDALKNKDNQDILNNGKTDLVVLHFNHPSDDSDYQEKANHDSKVAVVINAVTELSSTYLAIFTGNNDNTETEIQHSRKASHLGTRELRGFEVVYGQDGDVLYSTNWPDGVIEGLLVMVPFLAILFIGLCCTLQLQSELKFDAEKSILKKHL